MISVEQAQEILAKMGANPTHETVPLRDSLNRILAQKVVSTVDLPPVNKSAMDGFAVMSSDKSSRFKIVETIAAGSVPQRSIK